MTKIYKIALIFLFFGILPVTADAATLFFSPSSGGYATGQTFPVGVYVSSADQAMNAASGKISFPQDTLEVVSVSKTGSIFDFWVEEPSFSNNAGTANFEGIVLNPGFIGVGGKIMTINFRVKAPGTAPLNFPSGSVLANDGRGTNILTGLGSAQFTLSSAAATPPPPPPPPSTPPMSYGTPAAPVISSPTHPDSDKWYNSPSHKFVWNIPEKITAVKILYNKYPNSAPIVLYEPPISGKEIGDLKDGVFYFHAQFRNSNGWGKISHFLFKVDKEKPVSFNITEIPLIEPTEQKAKFIFEAEDATSGIDYYEVVIDDQNAYVWIDDGGHQYETPVVSAGRHILTAKAFDRAGNSLVNSVGFTVQEIIPEVTVVPVVVEEPIVNFGLATNVLSLVVPLVALIFLLLFILWYGWHKFTLLKMRFKKEIRDAESALHRSFVFLKENIQEQINMLEKISVKRRLTEEEDQILKQDKKNLTEVELFLNKKISKIEKIGKSE